jgi:hypothetical protein
VLVETEKGAYELVEDVHSVLAHSITKCLIADVPTVVAGETDVGITGVAVSV